MKTLIFFALLTFPLGAVNPTSPIAPSTQADQREVNLPQESIKTANTTLNYTPYRGFCDVQDGDQKENSRIHYIAYIAEPANNSRPLFFCFNGGPGSSSVWLHMGLLGPQIVQLKSGSGAPFPTADNAFFTINAYRTIGIRRG